MLNPIEFKCHQVEIVVVDSADLKPFSSAKSRFPNIWDRAEI